MTRTLCITSHVTLRVSDVNRPDPTRPDPSVTTCARLHHYVAVGNARESINAMMRYAESTVAA